jgi:hypothetical protein
VTFIHPPARHSSRLGQRLQVALGAAAALAAISLSPGSAQAYVVTVNGAQYNLSTETAVNRFDYAYKNTPWYTTYTIPTSNPSWNFNAWYAAYDAAATVAGSLATEIKFSLGEFESYTQAADASNNYTANNIKQGPLFVFYTDASNGTGNYEYIRWVEKTWYIDNSYCDDFDCYENYVVDTSYGPNGYGGGVYRNNDLQYWIGGRTLVAASQAASAVPAPGPLPLFGAAAAFCFSRKLRKRIKLAPDVLASNQPLA